MDSIIEKDLIKNNRLYTYLEILCIVVFAIIPLFMKFHYRNFMYISWEGSYRLYLGEIPYRDFGLPLGFGFFIVPAAFFKIFGPTLMSLIKAQVFLNILSGLAFRSILKSLKVAPPVILLSILLYCVSFSFNNFWPWYNHTVIIYEFISLAFLFSLFNQENRRFWDYKIILSAFFIFLSFFTKQDAGFLGFLIGISLTLFNDFRIKNYLISISLFLWTFLIGTLVFMSFAKYGIGYWFNYGQAPHTSRISLYDLLDAFLKGSSYIKFYILFIFIIFIAGFTKNFKQSFKATTRNGLFLILTIGILFEASIFQVTSYVPADNNIFFHSFAMAYIFTFFPISIGLEKKSILALMSIFILIWWSNVFWQYSFFQNLIPKSKLVLPDSVITLNTYEIKPKNPTIIPPNLWIPISLKSLKGMLLPPTTVTGINHIMNLPIVKKNDMQLLNMTELTPLDYELKAKMETGKNIPLWYHNGVGMFKPQTDEYCKKIKNSFYDLALYEYIPYLNNLFSFRVQDTLEKYYQKIDQFTAPRNPSNDAFIKVYIRKEGKNYLNSISGESKSLK